MDRVSRRGGTLLAAAALLVVLALTAAYAVTQVTFVSTPVDLSQDLTTTSHPPSVSVTQRTGVGGTIVHYVWREETAAANMAIHYRRSLDGGSSFESTVILTPEPGGNRGDPKIVADGDEIVVVWSERGQLCAKFSGDSGQSFPNDSRPISAAQNADTAAFGVSYAGSALPSSGSGADFALVWVRTTDSAVFLARQDVAAGSNDTFPMPDSWSMDSYRPIHSIVAQWEPQSVSRPGDSCGVTATILFANSTDIRLMDFREFFDTNTGSRLFQRNHLADLVVFDTLLSDPIDGFNSASNVGGLALVNEGANVYLAWAQRDLNGETTVFFDHNRNGGVDPSLFVNNTTNFSTVYGFARRKDSVYGTDIQLAAIGGDGYNAVGGLSMKAAQGSEKLQIVWFEYNAATDTGQVMQRSVTKPTATSVAVDLSQRGTLLGVARAPIAARRSGGGFPTTNGAVAVAFIDDTGAGTDVFTTQSQTRDGDGPKITRAIFNDVDRDSAVSSGDTIDISFSENFRIATALSPSDFSLPVTGDNFGIAAASLSDTSGVRVRRYDTAAYAAQNIGDVVRYARITLGSTDTVVLTVNGVFSSANLPIGSPSGLEFSPGSLSKIQDLEGNNAVQTGLGGVDIEGQIGIDTASEAAEDSAAATESAAAVARSEGQQVCLVERLGAGPRLLRPLRGCRDLALAGPLGRSAASAYYRACRLFGLAVVAAVAPVLSFIVWRRTKRNSSPS